jgi:hypothetical protein
VSEHLVESGPSGNTHQRGRVSHQRQRRQRTLADDDGVHELDGDMLGIGGRATVAEGQQLAAAQEPDGHVMACVGEAVGGTGQRGASGLPARERLRRHPTQHF